MAARLFDYNCVRLDLRTKQSNEEPIHNQQCGDAHPVAPMQDCCSWLLDGPSAILTSYTAAWHAAAPIGVDWNQSLG